MDTMILPKTPWKSGNAGPLTTSTEMAIGQLLAVGPISTLHPARGLSRFGEMLVEEASFPARVCLPPTAAKIAIVVPRQGAAVIRCDDQRIEVAPGQIAVASRESGAVIEWQDGSKGLVICVSRVQIQAFASRILGTPRRMGAVLAVFAIDKAAAGPELALEAITRQLGSIVDGNSPTARRAEAKFVEAITRSLLASDRPIDVFPVAGSVARAIDYIHRRAGAASTLDEVARAGGVTASTMRKNFRACLGVSLSAYIQNARLESARRQLLSAKDSRPIVEFAAEAGFSCAAVFSRAYFRKFSELPTHTRANAVRAIN